MITMKKYPRISTVDELIINSILRDLHKWHPTPRNSSQIARNIKIYSENVRFHLNNLENQGRVCSAKKGNQILWSLTENEN